MVGIFERVIRITSGSAGLSLSTSKLGWVFFLK
jgi:hypothetical protein